MSRKIRTIVLIALTALAMMLPVTASAATEKSKALTAYKNLLTKTSVTYVDNAGKTGTFYKNSKLKFTLAYIDNDSVPELALYDYQYQPCIWLFTYRNGKLTYVDWFRDVSDTVFSYYPKKGIYRHSSFQAGWDYLYYTKFSKGVSREWLLRSKNVGSATSSDKIGSIIYKVKTSSKWSRITYKCFKNQLSKYAGSTAVKKVAFHKNAVATRDQYLK